VKSENVKEKARKKKVAKRIKRDRYRDGQTMRRK